MPTDTCAPMPTAANEPTELHADLIDVRLEHDRRIADAELRRPEPFPPIPHYAISPDAKTRTTAVSTAPQDHVGNTALLGNDSEK